jgi:beta-glucanase (GH16 family)
MPVTLATPSGFTASDLVFSDNFSGGSLNASSWNTYMASSQYGVWFSNGSGGSAIARPGSYDAEYYMPSQVSVNNGLTLSAVRQSITANGGTYPVTSGIVTTYGKMEFDGGYLQISMKEPGGDGSWPALWLLPGKSAGNASDNFEIDMQEGDFKDGAANPNDVLAYHLHTASGTFGGQVNTGVDLTAGYNTYAINWVPGKSITWYLNGNAVGEITSAQAPIPNEPMELIMSNAVGSSSTGAFRTTLDSSTPKSMPMQIGDVQLYQAPGSGDKITGSNATGDSPPPTTGQGGTTSPNDLAASSDFNGDGHSDILWQNTNGQAAIWEMNGTNVIGNSMVGANPGPSWKAIGTGDFNGDGHSDILWQNTDGQASIWEMNGTKVISEANVGANPGPSWKAIGTGDFNDDGHSDILWQNTNGQAAIWEMNGTNVLGEANVGANPGPSWKAIKTGDYNGDGHSDILWQNTSSGQAEIWEMNGAKLISEAAVGAAPGPSWLAKA